MTPEAFTPLGPPDRNSGLREWVRGEIWARISDGRLRPGQRLLEREVAEGLSVSRVPVREALRLLEAEGYVQALPGGGVMVRELSVEEINEMFDVRGALEGLAARLAARNSSAERIEQMEQLLEQNRKAIEESSGTEIGRINRQFHQHIRAAAGNRFVAERVEPLIGRLMWAFSESPDPERVWRGHRLLLAAIAARDEEAAVRAAHADNEHNREIALKQLAGSAPKAW